MPKSTLDWLGVVSLWIGALVFAIKSVEAPLMPGAPSFLASEIWNFAPLSFVTVALAIIVYRQLHPLRAVPQPPNPGPVESLLELRIHGGGRTPTGVRTDNIWRWFTLAFEVVSVSRESGFAPPKPMAAVLFIAFDRPTVTRNLSISSPDMSLPRHEVKDFNARTAIIAFANELSPGTLIVRAHH